MTWLGRLVASFRGEPLPDNLAAVRPKVTPDPRAVEALQRRVADRRYSPENGFHAEQRQPRSNVVHMRRRVRS